MSNRKRVLILIFIMALSALLVSGITIFSLYQAAISEERERLVETAQSQARLIEAVARFDAASAKSDGSESARSTTLIKIIEAHMNYEQVRQDNGVHPCRTKGRFDHFFVHPPTWRPRKTKTDRFWFETCRANEASAIRAFWNIGRR